MITLFFRQPRLLLLTVALILVGGLSAFLTMPQDEDPRITNRYPLVLTAYPGAGAERVEKLVTEKLEEEIRQIPEVVKIESTSRNGLSLIAIELGDAVTDTTGAFAEIRDAIDDASAGFPAGAGEPEFSDDRTYAYTRIVGLTWEAAGEPDFVILRRLARDLQDRLRAVPNTDLVTIHGAPEEEFRVELDPAALAGLGLTPADIASRVGAADTRIAAGQIRGANDLIIEVEGEIDGLTRLRGLPIASGSDGSILRLGDLARVVRTTVSPPDELAYVRGTPAVMVAARMQGDIRADSWSEAVHAILDDFEADLTEGVGLTVLFDQVFYIHDRLASLLTNLVIGIALVVMLLFVTLGRRAALIVTLSIPLTTLAAITVLNMTGTPIHQMSVTGLIVALGLLVDAAIVMVDAVQRRLTRGESRVEAIAGSVRQLWVPLLASTLTTVLGFLPILLAPGSVSEFVGPIAISVIAALIASLLLAMTVVPSVAARVLRAERAGGADWGGAVLGRWFRRSLRWSLAFPVSSMLLAAALPVLGFVGMTTLRSQFFPEADRNQFRIEVELPAQAGIERTRALVHRLDAHLEDHDEITAVDWVIGASPPKFYYNVQMQNDRNPAYAEAQVTTRSIAGIKPLVLRLQPELDAAFPQARILVRMISQGPPTAAPVELRLTGPDIDQLRAIGEEARLLLSRIPEVTHTRVSLGGGEPRVMIAADEDASLRAGLPLTALAGQLSGQLQGVAGGSVIEGDEEIPVRFRIGDGWRGDLSRLADLPLSAPLASATGDAVPALPLSALGPVRLQPAETLITRYQGERANIVSGFVDADALPSDVVIDFQKLWDEKADRLPPGYRLTIGGDAEARSDAVSRLASSAGLIAVAMIATIVLTFNSFRLSGIVFLVAIQAAGLGLLSLTLFNHPFGFQPIIALLGLVGVAINAAIIILSALKGDAGAASGAIAEIIERVVETARHITSTTLTTFAGFLPLILSEGGFWPPFATAIAGGVLLSTVLSFYFVPPAFRLLVTHCGYQAPVLQRATA